MKAPEVAPIQDGRMPAPREERLDVEARHRASTLVGISRPLGSSEVQVWSPRNERLYLPTLLFGGVSLVYTYECLALSVPSATLLIHVAILCVFFGLFIGYAALTVSGMLHPSYIVADGEGIAFAGKGGARSIRWGDIRSLRRVDDVYQGFRIEAPECEEIDLSSYPASVQQDLFHFIAAAAHLETHPGQEDYYICAEPIPAGLRSGFPEPVAALHAPVRPEKTGGSDAFQA